MGMICNFLRVSEDEFLHYLADSSLLEYKIDALCSNSTDALIDIDKSWGGILFLLTGGGVGQYEHPMAKVLFSGQLIGEEQGLDRYPVNYLTPQQVKELCAEIYKIGLEELKRRYDPVKMNEEMVYRGFWGESRFEYLSENFEVLKQFYLKAASGNEAIISYIS